MTILPCQWGSHPWSQLEFCTKDCLFVPQKSAGAASHNMQSFVTNLAAKQPIGREIAKANSVRCLPDIAGYLGNCTVNRDATSPAAGVIRQAREEGGLMMACSDTVAPRRYASSV